jgi:uncharacterized protein YutE (UPF0331/DUF86 family)
MRFPTHRHVAEFWEHLGRVVATFGFLEEMLGKGIFAFSATKQYPESEIEAAFERWLPTLQSALIDPLGSLIESFGRAVRDNQDATIENLDDLLDDLRKASRVRNVLCHGSWGVPDAAGRSVPLFVNRHKEVFETPIDVPFLQQTQRHAAELACAVINTVTHMGWQFPGSSGPGDPIMAH